MEDILEVLKTGMEIELNGITLYKSASERTDDPKAKEVFDFLSQEEVPYKNNRYDYSDDDPMFFFKLHLSVFKNVYFSPL